MEPDAIDNVWRALGKLTYAEMIEFAAALRDYGQACGMDAEDAHSWAQVLDGARLNALEQPE